MAVSKLISLLLAPLLALTLMVTPARADGPPIGTATPQQQKAFGKQLAQGNKLFKAGKFDDAIKAFQEAYEVVADPEARLMIARAQQNLGDLQKAHAEYAGAISELESAAPHGDKYRNLLKAAQTELEELEGVVAWLTIKLRFAPEGTTVTIEGESIDHEQLSQPILLSPGPVNVVATTPGGREASRQLTLNAGQQAKVELAFVRDDEPIVEEGIESEREQEKPAESSSSGGGTRTAAFIAGGVGIAGLATFGIFGAMSNSKYNELADACSNGICPASRRADADDGRTFQTIANIGLAVGVVGLATSAGLFIFGGSGSSEKAPEEARLDMRLGVQSIELRGRFQ